MTFTLLHQPRHLSLKKWLWDFDWFLWPMQNMNSCPWWPYPTLTSSYISNIQNTCYFLTSFWQVQFRCIKCRCWRAFKMQNTGYLVSQQVLGINLAKNLLMSGKENKFVRVPISEISFQFVAVFEIFSIFRKRRKRLKPVGTVNTLYDESGCTNTDPNLFFFSREKYYSNRSLLLFLRTLERKR